MDAAETPPESGLPSNLVFVDLETTGADPDRHRITEVGVIRMRDGEVVEEWSSLINPLMPIPAYIENFTGISNEMAAAAPTFADVASVVAGKLAGAVFVAHNARFDYSFLRSELARAGQPFEAQVVCTLKLSRRLFPQYPRHNLDAIMQRHGLTCSARHRALGDAQVLRDLWQRLCRDLPRGVLGEAVAHAALGEPRLPLHLPQSLQDELPDAPGVYRLHGVEGEVLFVGRGKSLRSRILEQLGSQSAGPRDRRLRNEVRRVEWRETSGELGALLLEAQWLGKYPPRNRHGRQGLEPVTLVADEPTGRVEIVPLSCLDAGQFETCFGVFHAAKDARKALHDVARANQLCFKTLGLEATPGSCLGYQTGRCRGACVGKEPHALHGMRMQLALSALKIKRWPFPPRIGLKEGGEMHVLDSWSYLGTARSEEDLCTLSQVAPRGPFDADTYRILSRFFATHARLEWRELRPHGAP
jgi:DNA polymerase-3 subunit epsilon